MIFARNAIRNARAVAALPLLCLLLTGCLGVPFAKPVTGSITTPVRLADGTPAPASATVPFTLDGGRIYVELPFRKPDGGVRKALVWVNFGVGAMSISSALHHELGDGPVEFSMGGIPVRVGGPAIQSETPDIFSQLGPLPVEAVLPAGMWPLFRVTLDYPARTLTLEQPTSAPAPGVAVPIKVNDQTGLIAVEARVDGRDYPVVLDAGSGYTWIRGADVRRWLPAHPDWYRADGALGASNQAMAGENVEQLGTVVRVPSIQLGPLTLRDVGVLGTAPAHGHPLDQVKDALLWRLWGQGAPEPVIGWIGANAMRPYRITFDYQNRVSYWLRTGEPEAGELDSVGVSLIHGTRNYFIGSVISRHGQAAVTGMDVGDKLLAIDGQAAPAMTRGTIMQALRGRPGDHRRLTLERNGAVVIVDAVILAERPVSSGD